jgi:hypothetical protein
MAPFVPNWSQNPPIQSLESAQIQSADRLSLTDASDLLDWLENHGIAAREVVCDAEGLMSIRWAASC